ncbi:unnamed protein product [Didymodactylos carnosus]|uniref:Serpin domain-containing protein n=1 Tax=Didymodactylos carnosus TaxID=1234261 RepID=A0A815DZU1_9BILA|nr:unnamed protein product [Didymodactylos carnosus]CAF4135646.1 unnamed protein product [Didymodactylos carnosus]
MQIFILQSQILFIPYNSSNQTKAQYVFTVILPNRRVQLEQMEQLLTEPLFNQLQKTKKQSRHVDLYLPKFKM